MTCSIRKLLYKFFEKKPKMFYQWPFYAFPIIHTYCFRQSEILKNHLQKLMIFFISSSPGLSETQWINHQKLEILTNFYAGSYFLYVRWTNLSLNLKHAARQRLLVHGQEIHYSYLTIRQDFNCLLIDSFHYFYLKSDCYHQINVNYLSIKYDNK